VHSLRINHPHKQDKLWFLFKTIQRTSREHELSSHYKLKGKVPSQLYVVSNLYDFCGTEEMKSLLDRKKMCLIDKYSLSPRHANKILCLQSQVESGNQNELNVGNYV